MRLRQRLRVSVSRLAVLFRERAALSARLAEVDAEIAAVMGASLDDPRLPPRVSRADEAALAELGVRVPDSVRSPVARRPVSRRRSVVGIDDQIRAAKAARRLGLDRGVKIVYFVQVETDGPIKIGFTVDMAGRFGALQTSSPHALRLLGTVPGDEERERQIHEEFEHLRMQGEWFKPAPELLDFIAEVLR